MDSLAGITLGFLSKVDHFLCLNPTKKRYISLRITIAFSKSSTTSFSN